MLPLPRHRARTAGGKSSNDSREDSGGAGLRGEVRSPDPSSPPAQVRVPDPGPSSPGSAASRGRPPHKEGVRYVAGKNTEEQRAARRSRRGGLGGISVGSRKLSAGEEQEEAGAQRGPCTGAGAAGAAAVPRRGERGSRLGSSGDPVPRGHSSGRPRAAGDRGVAGNSSGGARGVGGAGRGRALDSRQAAGGPRGGAPRGGRLPQLGDVSELSELAAIIEQHAAGWAAAKSMRAIVTSFNKLAKLATQAGADSDLGRRAFHTLAAAYLPLVPGIDHPVQCAIPLWASAKMEVWGDGRLARELLRRLGQRSAGGGPGMLQTASAQEHANLWWALSRDAPREVMDAAEEVLRESATCLLRMGPKQFEVAQNCSNVLHACARLPWYEEPALVHHLTASLVSMPGATCQNLANALYSLGELAEDCRHQPCSQALEGLAEQVVVRLERQRDGWGSEQRARPGQAGQPDGNKIQDSFKPQELSNMLLGCAKLGHGDPELLQPLVAAAGQAADRFKSQELANSLYALAKLGCNGDSTLYGPGVRSLYDAVIQLLRDAPNGFEPQGLSNLLWALESVHPQGSQDYARVLLQDCMERGFSGFKPQELSNILLALEGLRPEGFGIYAEAVAAECRRRAFAGFNPQAISNSIWALAKMGLPLAGTTEQDPYQSWYEAAVQAAMQHGVMNGATPQSWSNLLYGLALVRHRPPKDLLLVMQEGGQQGPLVTLRADASSQHCANLLWALAVLGLWSEQGLVEALAGRLRELLRTDPSQLGGQILSNSLWALAVMGPEVLVHRHGALVGELLREVTKRLRGKAGRKPAPFKAEELSQLRQVQLELEHAAEAAAGDGRSVRDLASVLASEPLVKDARPVGDSKASMFQMEVAASLDGLQQTPVVAISARCVIASVRQEYEVEGPGCRVDVLVELAGGRRVALEVDGPSHFLANDPHTKRRTGRTLLRDRQLERVFGAGNMVSVPYWEWNKLQCDDERQEYLARLLGLGSAGQ